jgi:hypothetical protein
MDSTHVFLHFSYVSSSLCQMILIYLHIGSTPKQGSLKPCISIISPRDLSTNLLYFSEFVTDRGVILEKQNTMKRLRSF